MLTKNMTKKEFLSKVNRRICEENGWSLTDLSLQSPMELKDFFDMQKVVHKGETTFTDHYVSQIQVFSSTLGTATRYFAHEVLAHIDGEMDAFDIGWQFTTLDTLIEVEKVTVPMDVFTPVEAEDRTDQFVDEIIE